MSAQEPTLAAEHQGMRVDYTGMLRQASDATKASGEQFHAFMLTELANHMGELGRRYYAGDLVAVDEFLQLYCVARDARAALIKAGGAVAKPRDEQAQLAFAIAQDAAVSEVECDCPLVERDGRRWYETDPDRWGFIHGRAPFELNMLARAVRFCDEMKVLQRHPEQPTLVRFPHIQR